MLGTYLIGVVTAPLVVKAVKPVLRGAVKASVGVALEVRNAVAEVTAEIQSDAVEVIAKKAPSTKK